MSMGVWEVAVVEEYLEGVSGFLVAGEVQRTVSEPQVFRAERVSVGPIAPRKTWTD